MKLDIVIPIKSNILNLAIEKTIPSIFKHLNLNNIYVITKYDNFTALLNEFKNTIILIDEDKLVKDLSFNKVSKYLFDRTGSSGRTGWYFQQFLKLGISFNDKLTEHYLVWDADAILLKPFQFFNSKNQIFITKSKGIHNPYFETLYKLLGIKRQVNYSFISEQLVFKKEYVRNMINEITKESKEVWWKLILDNVDDTNINKSGFSEYETYGNYVISNYPETLATRYLSKFRHGTLIFGLNPTDKQLRLFSNIVHYISFETSQKKIESFIGRNMYMISTISKTILKNIISLITFNSY